MPGRGYYCEVLTQAATLAVDGLDELYGETERRLRGPKKERGPLRLRDRDGHGAKRD